MINSNKPKTIFSSSFLTVHHGFGSKLLGDGRNITLLQQYLDTQSLKYTNIVQPHQTHSTNVQIITVDNFSDKIVRISDCDGIVTKEKNVVLTVVTADCVPIIFYDPTKRIVGISHQGWKGTTNKLPQYMIEQMQLLGSEAADIKCAMGPAINICCYHMNLYQINRDTLIQLGVLGTNIDIFPFCTCCDEKRFFSYRREGRINGEMIHYVMMS